MRKILLLSSFLAMFATGSSAQWKPAGDKIKTKWASQVDPANVLPEYPRPIMERKDWKNLNGLWSYAIIDKGGRISATFDGEILVPFAVESSLSGVGKRIDENKELVYQRSFSIPSGWKGRRVLLHFGAVDWKADVWVNDVKVGSHTGGFTPFSFDITAALSAKGDNRLMVKAWDPTDKGPQPRGKQVGNPHGIWYTPVSGIWQTVWMEPVAEKHIANLRITPDIDRRLLTVKAELSTNTPSDMVEVTVYDGNRPVASGKSINAEAVEVSMPDDAKLWSPDAPFLYTLKVTLKSGGKVADEVDSYAAMRKYSTRRDADGIVRLELNNEPLFQFGPLDQGWWPDGLYTAPTDEALLYDIRKTKDFGFNMIRKHIKVEPARWYTHCDRLGIIVWQDMPSGDRNPEWQNRKYFDGTELKRTAESEACYRKEWKEIMDCLYSYPCIGTWVPFNEAWGQFKTAEIAEWTKQYDPTRLVNPASGGNHYACGDMLDLHNYPHPEMYLYDAGRATVLGEYGGIGLVLKDHLWEPNHNWGYVQFNSSKEVTDEYAKYADMLYRLIGRGFSAAVYTQTTDVEVEVNGLMTYDRKVIKPDEKRLKEINARICGALKK
ncbi:glycoside hydrolase family 2 protein [Bacteroides heparinolyticus]|uniref:glycoside hydrolase family 2 protein n=1 Tax=Prevotella heparinolytica TaxID=28113 RepID=UPI00359F6EE9